MAGPRMASLKLLEETEAVMSARHMTDSMHQAIPH